MKSDSLLILLVQTSCHWGRGGGQVVSVLAFYSDDPNSKPADAHSFFCKICVWKRTKKLQKEAGVDPFLKILVILLISFHGSFTFVN